MTDPSCESILDRRGPGPILCTVVLSAIVSLSGQVAKADEAPFGDLRAALAHASPSPDPQDRLEILNLIGFYAHLTDAFRTDSFGEFFIEEAVFTVVPFARDGEVVEPVVWKSRAEILAAVRPRHDSFRKGNVRRRHILTNPVVWQQTEKSARVAVYFQLVTSTDGGPPITVRTGRNEGLAIKTKQGWRMAEWTIHSDQRD